MSGGIEGNGDLEHDRATRITLLGCLEWVTRSGMVPEWLLGVGHDGLSITWGIRSYLVGIVGGIHQGRASGYTWGIFEGIWV